MQGFSGGNAGASIQPNAVDAAKTAGASLGITDGDVGTQADDFIRKNPGFASERKQVGQYYREKGATANQASFIDNPYVVSTDPATGASTYNDGTVTTPIHSEEIETLSIMRASAGPSLLAPQNLYTPLTSGVGDLSRYATQQASDPSNSGVVRTVYGLLGGLSKPLGLVNDATVGILNSFNGAYRGAQNAYIGIVTGDPNRTSSGLMEASTSVLNIAMLGSMTIAGVEANLATSTAESGVWKLNPLERGQQIEQGLGHNLPSNFPTIDRFENGIATSIKSIDLNAASYLNDATLNRTLTGYVDKTAAFNGRTWARRVIQSDDILGRGLDLAIPHSGNASQQAIINQAVRYGATRGVVVNPIIYP